MRVRQQSPRKKNFMSENNYHRYLNLPFELTKPSIVNSPSRDYPFHEELNDYEDPNIMPFLHNLGLKCNHVEVFYTPPNGGVLPIHTDLPQLDNRTKINLTWGPDDSTIRWWKIRDENDIITINGTHGDFSTEEHQNLMANEKDCDMVWEANTNRVSLCNVGQFHSTYNPGDFSRWTLCFHISKQDTFLPWDESLDYFADYLE